MSKIIKRAHELLDNLAVIPGYTDKNGRLVISIEQFEGGVRFVDVSFVTIDKVELNGCSMSRVTKSKLNIAKDATQCCENCKSRI